MKDDIMEEVMEDMKKLLKKEMGDDKQILRRMRLCFLPDKKVSKLPKLKMQTSLRRRTWMATSVMTLKRVSVC